MKSHYPFLTLGEPSWNFRKKFRRETLKNGVFLKSILTPDLDPSPRGCPTVPTYISQLTRPFTPYYHSPLQDVLACLYIWHRWTEMWGCETGDVFEGAVGASGITLLHILLLAALTCLELLPSWAQGLRVIPLPARSDTSYSSFLGWFVRRATLDQGIQRKSKEFGHEHPVCFQIKHLRWNYLSFWFISSFPPMQSSKMSLIPVRTSFTNDFLLLSAF